MSIGILSYYDDLRNFLIISGENCSLNVGKNDGITAVIAADAGDKPHHCHLCGKKFALLCNLKTHLKMHEGNSFHRQMQSQFNSQISVTSVA